MILTNLNLHYLRMLPFKFKLSGLIVFEKEIFNIYSYVKLDPPHCGPALPPGTMI